MGKCIGNNALLMPQKKDEFLHPFLTKPNLFSMKKN